MDVSIIQNILLPNSEVGNALKLSNSIGYAYAITPIKCEALSFVFSIYAKADSECVVTINAMGVLQNETIGNEWTRIIVEIPEKSEETIKIFPKTNGNVYLCRAMLQTGEICTDWVPAQEDISVDNIYVSGTTKINGGLIETNTIRADSIDTDDLFSQNITATNLHITGDSTFDGVLNGATGSFSGTVNASGLTVRECNTNMYDDGDGTHGEYATIIETRVTDYSDDMTISAYIGVMQTNTNMLIGAYVVCTNYSSASRTENILTLHADSVLIESISEDMVLIGGLEIEGNLTTTGTISAASTISASGFKAGATGYNSENIELYGNPPFIDFHAAYSSADYTSRIIDWGNRLEISTSGSLQVNSTTYISGALGVTGHITSRDSMACYGSACGFNINITDQYGVTCDRHSSTGTWLKNIWRSDANGDNYFYGHATSDLPLSGGTMSGNLTLSKAGETIITCTSTNTAAARVYVKTSQYTGQMVVNTTPNFGLYSSTSSKWLIYMGTGGTTTVANTSDERYKNKLGLMPDEEMLVILRNVSVHNFTFKEDKEGIIHNGIYAQELRDVLVENGITNRGYMLIESANGDMDLLTHDLTLPETDDIRYSVDYAKFTPVLWKGWQYHDTKINEIEAKQNDHQAQIEALYSMLSEAYEKIAALQNQLQAVSA